MARVGRIFLAGVLVLLPLAVTVVLVGWVVSLLSAYVGPKSWFGQALVALGLRVNDDAVAPYVIGLLFMAAAVFVIGLLVENRVGGGSAVRLTS